MCNFRQWYNDTEAFERETMEEDENWDIFEERES